MDEDQLVADYWRLAMSVANRAAKRFPAKLKDDIISAAGLGLLNAIRSYDPSRSAITTHIISKVRYAIIDEVRTQTGGRSKKYQRPTMMSLQTYNSERDSDIDILPGYCDPTDPADDFAAAMEELGLSSKEKVLFRGFFFDEKKQHEIGEKLGMSHSWVSSQINRAIDRCRRMAEKRCLI